MPYVITQSCCSDASCVSVCPVNCIHPTPEERGFGSSDILHIDPEACIDCGACADACPVDAIFPADRLGTRDKVFLEINANYYKENDDITSGWTDVVYPVIPKLPHDLRVAVVGTGPSAGYALRKILDRTPAKVTVLDKLPTPGGLVRAGVAPDHPSTKNVMRGFDLLYRDPRVTMATNVEVGGDTENGQITPAELAEHFDAVFYAVGASESRRLGIPGEDLPGSTSATELVAWYNAAPGVPVVGGGHDVVNAGPPIVVDGSHRAVVVGTGNVALDVARILVSPPEMLATTDIADRALKLLREQNIHEIVVLGRRDQANAAYTSAEYRALATIPGVEVVVHDEADPSADDLSALNLRNPADPSRRRIVFLFHSSPEEIVGDDRVDGVTVRTGEQRHQIAADLVVRSIGYRSVPIEGLPFDSARGVFPNADGRLLDDAGEVVPGVYITGWARRGPSGGIGANKLCAEQTVEEFISDAVAGRITRTAREAKEFPKLLRRRTRELIGYHGMRAIDRNERRLGAEQGRPRVKYTQVADMVGAAGWRKR
ncbi:FAD-dependent oxidoreductase [Gordonia soli]|uniref:ferredoxin--NADP(+) reductase n=1 Tax=Gordonia soli NBRC 108243 TaxID=1223545 RepID=M0QPE1_9ACTN|nr:FAD-dependent oxidoreductase [Gordonia soli]GAC70418.1 putative ferredoxin--NADP(+) reductase [Gordonia soli NBRC 108243]